VIGWDLILEYAVSVAAVAVGWGQYFNEFLNSTFGLTLPEFLIKAPTEGGAINIPAIVVVLAVTALLMVGVRESTRVNNVMVFVKVGILLLFIALAATAFNSDHLTPFATDGLAGITSAASLIFFSYIGFDAVSTSAEEARRPQRDVPIGILASLAITTILYCLVAVAATGALPFTEFKGASAPLAVVLKEGAGISWGASVLSFGAVIAMTSVVITVLYGQTRIMFAMSRDGLAPKAFSKLSPKTMTPVINTALFGLGIAFVAGLLPLVRITDLVNIGVLFAFAVVNIGVVVLRFTKPDLKRGFRVPIIWFCAPMGLLLCGYLMAQMTLSIWIGFIVWTLVGLAIYSLYGRRHSRLRAAAA
jgi:APA family basic amino acid/polyamine antiporter